MKSFGIESKFIADDEKNVTRYRRLVTPWFYINLKSINYELKVDGWIFLPFTAIAMRHTGWIDKSKDVWIFKSDNKDLISQLDSSVAEFKPNNVVRFR